MNTDPRSVTCEFCASVNPFGQNQCLACGAPLPRSEIKPLYVTEVKSASLPPLESAALPPQPMSQQLKEGLAVAATGLGALGISTVLLRLAAEAAAVAGAGLIIGMNAGSASISFQSAAFYSFLAAAGGAVTGLSIGLVTKRIFWSLVSAPAGALLGSLLAVLFRLKDFSQFPWTVLLSAAGGVFFALLGGRQGRKLPLRCLQILRPVLGLIGGLLFGLLGFLITHRIY